VKTWFQSLPFKFNLRHYNGGLVQVTAADGENAVMQRHVVDGQPVITAMDVGSDEPWAGGRIPCTE
jgi:hypothetical protein